MKAPIRAARARQASSTREPGATERPTPVLLQAPALAELPWLVHGFSTRQGGVSRLATSSRKQDLNLGKVAWDNPRNVAENRRRLISLLIPDRTAPQMTLIVQQQI